MVTEVLWCLQHWTGWPPRGLASTGALSASRARHARARGHPRRAVARRVAPRLSATPVVRRVRMAHRPAALVRDGGGGRHRRARRAPAVARRAGRNEGVHGRSGRARGYAAEAGLVAAQLEGASTRESGVAPVDTTMCVTTTHPRPSSDTNRPSRTALRRGAARRRSSRRFHFRAPRAFSSSLTPTGALFCAARRLAQARLL